MGDIEVLSPVGSKDSLVAAVRSGCDAVYLGATNFSARRKAVNFTNEDLLEAVKYCHKFGVKVYVTVNIMLKEKEISEAIELVGYLYSINVDGIIVQDLGLARLMHKYYPDLPLHGSTQMSVHQKDALKLLKEMGFKRVVVSRELNKEQLKEFCQEAKRLDIEVEHFVHGALCMSVSGQCLLSAMLGSRSGNRGLCAQPCRLPFKVDKGTGNDLSLKDACLFEYIDELKEMGVCSLKIEGRMKRSEYVSIATYCCRQAVDTGHIDEDKLKMLKDVFSRSGFTNGYYQNKLGRSMFGVRTIEDEKASADSFNKIHELYRHERSNVPLSFLVIAKVNEKLLIKVSDGINEVECIGEIVSSSENKLDKENVRNSLAKLGNTAYYLKDISFDCDEYIYIARSQLNQLRREAVEKLDELREKITFKEKAAIKEKAEDKDHKLTKTYIRIANKEQLVSDLSGVNRVIFPIESDLKDVDSELIVEIPRWLTNDKYIKERLRHHYDNGIRKAYCNNLSAIVIAREMGFEVMGGNYLNIANSQSALVLEQFGLKEITVSSELSFKELKEIKTNCDKGIISYGYLPLMLLVNCPLKNGRKCSECDKKGYIIDRMNIKFPIRCHLNVSELLNSAPIYLADRMTDASDNDYQILYFTIEDKKQVEKIINDYRNGNSPTGNFTTGLYYRSVK